MYSSFKLAAKYIRYYLTALNGRGHGMHSPFVYQLIRKVLMDQQQYPAYEKIETLRQQLRANMEFLEIEDYGAGSSIDKSSRRSISSLAINAAKPAKFGQLLYRLVQHYQPSAIIELGTSLGITTGYLSLANPRSTVYTLEGAPAVAAQAEKNFQSLGLKNIQLLTGKFDDQLPGLLASIGKPDLVFVDGNHRKTPTLAYFELLMRHIHADSILIFDDIHWSKEMEEAWEQIKADSRVRCSIDLFFIGIVFFREEFKEKQDFTIRF